MNHKPVPIEELTDERREVRDRFVNEYLKDFNATQAGIRMGIAESNAAQTCNNMYLKEEYVLTLIQEKLKTMSEETIITRAEILNGIKMIAYNGINENNRLSAWGKLAKLMGMEIDYIKAELTGAGGGPIITANMTADQAAEIYAREVLGRG